jgi:2',3'-cyclic-nucleotide 2'-phosphodiesterase (5'-nucleotidase family)
MQPIYEAQMVQLRKWLDEAKSTGIKKVFISFHAPVYCRAGMGPIPEAQNPHKTIASNAKDLDIVVFNGHTHTFVRTAIIANGTPVIQAGCYGAVLRRARDPDGRAREEGGILRASYHLRHNSGGCSPCQGHGGL